LSESHQAAAAKSLKRTCSDEEAEGRGFGAARRAEEEDRERPEQETAPTKRVAQAPVDRRGDGRAQKVRSYEPGDVRKASEVRGDGGQRRGDDRLIERADEHRRRDVEEDP
jgi:hypothetical protein